MTSSPSLERIGHLDTVGLPWLISVRWAGFLAQIGAVVAGTQGLTGTTRLPLSGVLIAGAIASNIWLSWQSRRRRPLPMAAGGWLVCADVAVLSWLLHEAGGVLNPVAIFYLVYIVLAALVLDRLWAWVVTALSIGGYGLLFLTPSAELAVAGSMHPEIGLHVRGMWLAFAGTSLLVAILVARLAVLIERRDRALAELRARADRDARLASLATLSAGAAHELSTPLATIAVAARELEVALARNHADDECLADARLIRAEVDRCRRVLHDMAARLSQPMGEVAMARAIDEVIDMAIAPLTAPQRQRIRRAGHADVQVVWPTGVVKQTLVNVIQNALQASKTAAPVIVNVAVTADRVALAVTDTGAGMSPDVLARAGEPFYTTKAQGEGMGLGLFVARSTVEQLGGTLTIDSREDIGTTVTMTLPIDVTRP